jgi:starch synthase
VPKRITGLVQNPNWLYFFMDSLKILFVSPEIVPFAKTGGLADVAGSLPRALKSLGCQVRLVMPLYQQVRQGGFPLKKILDDLWIPLGPQGLAADIYQGELEEGLPVYFIERDEFYDRSRLYGTIRGDYIDNDRRFVYLCRGTLALARALDFQPQVIHGHDWQTGLIPALLHFQRSGDLFFQDTATLFTIHNIAYQGLFPRSIIDLAGLPPESFSPQGLEYWGQVNLLKSGIVYSQIINTVSRKYSQEIQTSEFGYGLEGILQARKDDLFGIVNGVDYQVWNPAKDAFLAAPYTAQDLRGKKVCKRDLLDRFHLPQSRADYPLLGVISRLADQKGFDLLAGIMDRLLQEEVTLVILGTGDEKYHNLFSEWAAHFPDKIGLRLDFDNGLAHQIEAGCDIFLMPSRYEPCGLNQIYSLKYGTIPLVRATGGLDDTIIPYHAANGQGTGFKFAPYDTEAFWSCLEEALDLFQNRKAWEGLIKNAMAMDFSWEASAREYINLYHLARQRLRSP